MPFDESDFWEHEEQKRQLTLIVKCSDEKTHIFGGMAQGDWNKFWDRLEDNIAQEVGDKRILGGVYQLDGRSCGFIVSEPGSARKLIGEAQEFLMLWPAHVQYFSNVPVQQSMNNFNFEM